jgi:hypothetical protein
MRSLHVRAVLLLFIALGLGCDEAGRDGAARST